MAEGFLEWLPGIVPELMEIVEKRYTILRYISFTGPVGRRSLAERLGWGERLVRREMDFLREAGYIQVQPEGVRLTPLGEAIVAELEGLVHHTRGLTTLEEALRDGVNAGRVIIIPGDADQDLPARQKLVARAARILLAVLPADGVLAVMGGRTLALVIDHLPSGARWPGMVVAACGGLGEDAELQANSIAARLAQALGARCRLFHVPDCLSPAACSALLLDPKVVEVQGLIRSARVVLTGIGTAATMARRRGLTAGEWESLCRQGAVGEVFGSFFNQQGEIVGVYEGLGLRLADLTGGEHLVAVAGGCRKAAAVLAVSTYQFIDTLVIDESLARRLLTLIRQKA
ncbi:MAG: sugar-binding domain-containing protein [Heliobacteriaceae bacterium]|nr:sugar-binding domain-containing protein [Heliobacteriaceae bacterium]